MMARIRKSLDENQKGFTLVELLVVVIIIGILASIAIPVYLNQQGKAKESAAKADLANARTAVVVKLVDTPTWAPDATTGAVPDFTPSQYTTNLKIASFNADGTFCIEARSNGKRFSTRQSGGIEAKDCAGVA